jgi:hypothetical protein
VQPRRSKSTFVTLAKIFSFRGFGGGQGFDGYPRPTRRFDGQGFVGHPRPSRGWPSKRDLAGVGSLSATRSQDISYDNLYIFCYHKRVPKLEIFAKKREVHFNLCAAKAILWNETIRAHVLPEHKPQRLPYFNNVSDSDSQ